MGGGGEVAVEVLGGLASGFWGAFGREGELIFVFWAVGQLMWMLLRRCRSLCGLSLSLWGRDERVWYWLEREMG